MPNNEPAIDSENGFERSALVMAELEGKLKAIAGYDEILWKIRAGYVGILYGSLAIIIGTNGINNLNTLMDDERRLLTLFLLVAGFSFSSYIVDRTYLSKKIRVIVARNFLVKLLFNKEVETTNSLFSLLMISGELRESELPDQAREEFSRIFSENHWGELLPIYATAPCLMLCIYLAVYYIGVQTALW
jgi:hypothetical protein